MLRKYKALYWKDNHVIATSIVESHNEDEAIFDAECKMMIFFPKISYDEVWVSELEEN